jgi:hypothetical protein
MHMRRWVQPWAFYYRTIVLLPMHDEVPLSTIVDGVADRLIGPHHVFRGCKLQVYVEDA